MFGSLLDRPIIKEKFDARYSYLLSIFNDSLDEVKQIFGGHIADVANEVWALFTVDFNYLSRTSRNWVTVAIFHTERSCIR